MKTYLIVYDRGKWHGQVTLKAHSKEEALSLFYGIVNKDEITFLTIYG